MLGNLACWQLNEPKLLTNELKQITQQGELFEMRSATSKSIFASAKSLQNIYVDIFLYEVLA